MIESVEGLKNLDEIAAVPGVGALFLGAGSDLSRSMGIAPTSPELETAFQQILAACKPHDVACGITANSGDDVARRVRKAGESSARPCPRSPPAAPSSHNASK